MRSETVFVMISLLAVALCDTALQHGEDEPRGKKKKIALFVFFADLVIKKIFILKLVYAFVFWVVIHKAGYFLTWFARYLKEQKKECHEHDHDHYDHHHHDSPHYSYGPYRRKGEGFR